MTNCEERPSSAESNGKDAVEAAKSKKVDADRRELMQKALKVGASAPVMMALFAGRKSSASGTGVGGSPFP